jgi:alanine-synthesizing transaminase
VIELLRATHILITNGTGFNYPKHDHVRIVALPSVGDLTVAIGRIAEFLGSKRR